MGRVAAAAPSAALTTAGKVKSVAEVANSQQEDNILIMKDQVTVLPRLQHSVAPQALAEQTGFPKSNVICT